MPRNTNQNKSLSPNQKKEIVNIVHSTIQAEISATSFSGPVPPPEILAKYGDISPDYIDRIFKMAEKEQEQTHYVERELLKKSFERNTPF